MPDEYRGCRVMSTLPFAFNDFGYRAGLSRDFVFTDIDTIIDCLNAGNPEVPEFHAIILAFAEQFEYDMVDRPSSIEDHELGVVTVSPKLWMIPDVYAFLHAVFNSGHDSLGKPASAIHDLYRECQAVKKHKRTAIINAAASLQTAYMTAVCNGMWVGLQPKQRKQTPAPVSGTTGRARTAIPKDVPRFFVFVQAAATKSIVLIDGDQIVPLARTTDESPPGVLCDKVANSIAYLREMAGPNVESCVFGLSTRAF